MMVLLLMVMFLSSVQPVLMVVSLIFIVLLYSLFMFFNLGSYWYSYALVLVLLSGVMVVFMYMASLIPNESFEIYNLVFLGVFLWIFVFKNKFFYEEDISMVSFNLWNSYVGVVSLFLVVFLFMMMLMVVWLSCFSKGAVRVS